VEAIEVMQPRCRRTAEPGVTEEQRGCHGPLLPRWRDAGDGDDPSILTTPGSVVDQRPHVLPAEAEFAELPIGGNAVLAPEELLGALERCRGVVVGAQVVLSAVNCRKGKISSDWISKLAVNATARSQSSSEILLSRRVRARGRGCRRRSSGSNPRGA